MAKTFSIKWGKDGVPVGKGAVPPAIGQLLAAGHFRQEPKNDLLTPHQLKSKRLAEALRIVERDNPHRVMPEQIWEDLDIRSRSEEGTPRRIKVVALCWSEKGYYALAENLTTHRRSFVNLKYFCVRRKRGFKRIDAGADNQPRGPDVS